MPAHDLSEIWIGLRTALLSDSTLTALLGASGNIFREWPSVKVVWPAILMDAGNDNPQVQGSFTGVWRPELSLEIFAVNPDTCAAIKGRLDEAWTIPQNRQTAVSTTNLRLTQFRRTGQVAVGRVRPVNSDEWIHSLATLWACRVTRKTA